MIFESALPDERRILFRPIEPSDKNLQVDGFERYEDTTPEVTRSAHSDT